MSEVKLDANSGVLKRRGSLRSLWDRVTQTPTDLDAAQPVAASSPAPSTVDSPSARRTVQLNVHEFDAFVVDLDGVVTQTARTHFKSWKRAFDEFLQHNGQTDPFTHDDYTAHVDGRPRYLGVKAYLTSALGLTDVPFGKPSDAPGFDTMCALGNLKNSYFTEELSKPNGVQVYETTVQLLRTLKYDHKVQLACVSSSKNTKKILDITKLGGLFDVVVDGTYTAQQNLRGKPHPDTFLRACSLLDIPPQRAVVVEDALVGVQAGKAGFFQTVIGVNRGVGQQNLLDAGATVAVDDLGEVDVLLPEASFESLLPRLAHNPEMWHVQWTCYNKKQQMLSESLTTMGNGYFCSRGSLPFEDADNEFHYPATYLAGHYNRLDSVKNGKPICNEDLVAFPNWQYLSYRVLEVKGESKEQAEHRKAYGLQEGWLSLDDPNTVMSFSRHLDMRHGVLHSTFVVRDEEDHQTKVTVRQLVHMQFKHIGALEMVVEPLNWSGRLEVRSAINARVENLGVPRYRGLNQRHTVTISSEKFTAHDVQPEWPVLVMGPSPPATSTHPGDMLCVSVQTVQSHIEVAEAVRVEIFDHNGQPYAGVETTRVNVDEREWNTVTGSYDKALDAAQKLAFQHYDRDAGVAAQYFVLRVEAEHPVVIEKIVSVHSNKDAAISNPALAAKEEVASARRFGPLTVKQERAWVSLWHRFDTIVDVNLGDQQEFARKAHEEAQLSGACALTADNVQVIVRLHTFHTLQTLSPNSIGADVGIPARGWTGEAYRGHIFWDEVYIMPYITCRLPDLSASLLKYRFKRLPMARLNAYQNGFKGAMFPWQSSSDGREESQRVHLNPASGRWIPDNSSLQRHSNLAIAYNFFVYYRATSDSRFMQIMGAELLVQVARFFASAVTLNKEENRFELHNVMGPDEYHDMYWEEEEKGDDGQPGLSNNAYTNVMVAWLMDATLKSLHSLNPKRKRELIQRLRLSQNEMSLWVKIASRMKVCFHKDEQGNRIISQFEGYEKLEEFDWAGARKKHGNIQRLDRILEAENDSCNRYKLSKQADVLMLCYLFPPSKVIQMFKRLGYTISTVDLRNTVFYYLDRTSHGSSLSHLVHANVLAPYSSDLSWSHFLKVLMSDVADSQGGTTRECIHLGCMTGSVDTVQRSFTGLSIRHNVLYLDPVLPKQIKTIAFRMRFQEHWLRLCITNKSLAIAIETVTPMKPITAVICGQQVELAPGLEWVFGLGKHFTVYSRAVGLV